MRSLQMFMSSCTMPRFCTTMACRLSLAACSSALSRTAARFGAILSTYKIRSRRTGERRLANCSSRPKRLQILVLACRTILASL